MGWHISSFWVISIGQTRVWWSITWSIKFLIITIKFLIATSWKWPYKEMRSRTWSVSDIDTMKRLILALTLLILTILFHEVKADITLHNRGGKTWTCGPSIKIHSGHGWVHDVKMITIYPILTILLKMQIGKKQIYNCIRNLYAHFFNPFKVFTKMSARTCNWPSQFQQTCLHYFQQ